MRRGTRLGVQVTANTVAVLTLIGLVVAGASVSLSFKGRAEDALRSESDLNAVVSQVRLQDGLEWRAISGQPTDPIRARLSLSEARVMSLLRNSSDLGLPPTLRRQLVALQRRYHQLVMRELDLLDAGRTEAASRLDEESVDPAAESLLDALSSAAAALRLRNATLTRASDAGVVLSVALSLYMMVFLQRRFHRSQARHEEELRSEARYRSLIAQSSDLVIVCDSSGVISYLSPAAETALGPDALDGRRHRLDQYAHPDDVELLRTLLTSEQPVASTVDLRLGRSERECITYDVLVRDLTRDPAVGGLVLTCHDVTQARALDKAKGDFIDTVSHELRTPLTSIRGYLEMFAEGDFGALQPGQRQALGVIDRNAKRLLGLVDELLSLSGMGSARSGSHMVRTDLGEIIAASAQALDPLARASDIRIELPKLREAVLVVGISEQLERLVTNLMSNAVKFTPSGGCVSVATATTDSEVVFSVKDTGVGIPIAEQEHLFTRFFRSSYSKEKEIPGTGLGLAVCRSIVEAHHGTIGLESRPGAGTCVTVTLPRSHEAASEPQAPAPGGSAPARDLERGRPERADLAA